MARALQLARLGRLDASPNPMVGAVIVSEDGRIIGEGWHRRVGSGHAEVNAVASVAEADRRLFPSATMYVTLEPCSHYGRTPPCALLIINSGIRRVVVATLDPFPAVAGRGVAMLRDAGIEVVVGVMEAEARELNRRFFTVQTLHRPWVTLKWASSADGFTDISRDINGPTRPARFSSLIGQAEVHRLRACHDAILVGAGTVIADNPLLDTRHFPGSRAPQPVILDRRGRVDPSSRLFSRPDLVYITSSPRPDLPSTIEQITVPLDASPADILDILLRRGITSVLVEGGATIHRAFLDASLVDLIHTETAPFTLGPEGASPAPALPASARDEDLE